MTKHSMTALLKIREGVQALIDNPETYETALANYDRIEEALRYQCFETAETVDDYAQLSLMLDQMKIMKSICRLVYDIEFFEEDEEADHD